MSEREPSSVRGWRKSAVELMTVIPKYRVIYNVTTVLTFCIILLVGVALISAGIFAEHVPPPEDFDESGLQFQIQFSFVMGLVLFTYSTIGLYLICTNTLRDKVSYDG